MKLTASKMSRAALATANSGKRSPREGRSDVGALVSCTMVVVARVGVDRVGCAMVGVAGVGVAGVGCARVGVDRVGFARVGVARVGAGRVVGTGKGTGTGSYKSGKGESRDDFELHVVVFLVL